MKLYDAVVVGAGLAGLQCARRLAERGLRVLLADRKAEVGAPVHTTGIFVRKTLEDFALPESCLGPPVRELWLYSPRGRCVTFTSRRPEFRLASMRRLYERFLEAALRSDGVEWAPRHRFAGLRDGDADAELVFETSAGERRVRARCVIGADGVLSPVARALGLSRNREWIVGLEDVFPPAPGAGEPVFHCFIDPRLAPGYIAWAVDDPATGLHVGVGGYPDRFRPDRALGEFRERCARLLGLDLGAAIERRGGRIPVGGVLPRLACRRGLLVGDAAGAASPLTAGGLDACLRLSDYAAALVEAQLGGGARGLALADAYRGGRFARRFISRRLMRRLYAALSQPALLEAAFALLDLPPFRAAARHVFFGRGSFPDLPGASRAIRARSAWTAPR